MWAFWWSWRKSQPFNFIQIVHERCWAMLLDGMYAWFCQRCILWPILQILPASHECSGDSRVLGLLCVWAWIYKNWLWDILHRVLHTINVLNKWTRIFYYNFGSVNHPELFQIESKVSYHCRYSFFQLDNMKLCWGSKPSYFHTFHQFFRDNDDRLLALSGITGPSVGSIRTSLQTTKSADPWPLELHESLNQLWLDMKKLLALNSNPLPNFLPRPRLWNNHTNSILFGILVHRCPTGRSHFVH